MLYYFTFIRKLQYEYLRVSWCQSEDRFILILMKTKHPVHIIVVVMVTCDGEVMPLFNPPTETEHRGLNQVPGGGSAQDREGSR